MLPLIVEGVEDTPFVKLDKDNNVFQMGGRSLPEDVVRFYNPIHAWIEEYCADPLDKTVFDFYFKYFNTASSKQILEIMIKLEELKAEGKEVLIRWHYSGGDIDMIEEGEEYDRIVNLPFEYVSE